MKPVLIINCGSSKVPFIEENVARAGVRFHTVLLTELKNIEGYAVIIVSGAPILLTEADTLPYLEKAKIIFSDPKMPVLGICFGHQLMGIYHGAEVSRCKEDRAWQEITIHQKNALVNAGKARYMEDHCECISFPTGFLHLGSSTTCDNEMMKHPANAWYGVQFHPEVSEKAGFDLIANFIGLCRQH
jgi:GMP synthase (glutamine-hydrolysing)